MRNVNITVEGTVLTITVKLDETGVVSATGKSNVVATTEGNIPVPGTDLRLGLNLYRKVSRG